MVPIHAMKTYRRADVWIYSRLTFALDGDKLSASLYLRVKIPDTRWIWDSVDPTADFYILEK